MGADKFGWRTGGKASLPLPMGASEVIKALGGHFVTLDASGRGEVSAAASATVFGWVEAPEETTSATEGETIYNCIFDPSAVFRIPINTGTFAQSMVGKTCDLSVVNSIQGAALDASSRDIVLIVGGNATEGWVDVMIVPAKQIVAGVV